MAHPGQDRNSKVAEKCHFPAILHAPPKVRRYGYSDAASWPLVSKGKDSTGKFASSFRVAPAEAWAGYPSIELRASNSWPCMIFDVDSRGYETGAERYLNARLDLPPPSWTVTRESSGGVHVVYNLASPVHRGETARQRPLKAFARVSEYFAQVLDADPGYRGVLSHNPMSRPQGPDLRTCWGRKEPYELNELARIVPTRWRMPDQRKTPGGNNCALFESMMKFAGSVHNLDSPILPVALLSNKHLKKPLPHAEVVGIAKSVEKYRAKWICQGKFVRNTREEQAKRGRASGKARREQTALRDAMIVQAVTGGQSMRSVAGEYRLSLRTVQNIIQREVPMFATEPSMESVKPWEAAGVSRRTWYRYRKAVDAESTSGAENRPIDGSAAPIPASSSGSAP